MEVGKKYFEELIDKMKEAKGVELDVELTAEDLKELASQFKAEYKEKIGKDATTSSPCAFVKNSPKRPFLPVAGSRVKATPVPQSSPMLPNAID